MRRHIIEKMARRHELILCRDGNGEYFLTDLNNCVAAPGPMSLEEAALWLEDLGEINAQ